MTLMTVGLTKRLLQIDDDDDGGGEDGENVCIG